MPRGPAIPPRVRELIARVYYEHTDWTAKEIQNDVNALVRKGHLSLKPDWPGLSAIQKELNNLRKSPNPQDRPWNILTLSEYNLPADALPAVLQAWVHTTLNTSRAFTIREAKWVAWLHCVITDTSQLTKVARSYAFWEYIGERYGSRFQYPTTDHKLFEIITGRELSEEQRDKLLDERLKGLGKLFKDTWLTPKKEDLLRFEKEAAEKGFFEDIEIQKWWGEPQ